MTHPESWPRPENFTRETSLDEKCVSLLLLILKSTYQMRTQIVNGEAQTTAFSDVYESSDENEGAIRIRQMIAFMNNAEMSADALHNRHDLGSEDNEGSFRVYSLERGDHPLDGDIGDYEDHDLYNWKGIVSVILESKRDDDFNLEDPLVSVHLVDTQTGVELSQEEKYNLLLLLNALHIEAGLNEIEVREDATSIASPVVDGPSEDEKPIFEKFTHQNTFLPPQCGECSARELICIHATHLLN